MRSTKPTPISETLSLFKDNFDKRKKYVKNEFQAYGLELATELDDWKNKSISEFLLLKAHGEIENENN